MARGWPTPEPPRPAIQPATPLASRPAIPLASRPRTPPASRPAIPLASRPRTPPASRPAAPSASRPTLPSLSRTTLLRDRWNAAALAPAPGELAASPDAGRNRSRTDGVSYAGGPLPATEPRPPPGRGLVMRRRPLAALLALREARRRG